MVFSPEPGPRILGGGEDATMVEEREEEEGDYANQEIIEERMSGNQEGDYANQEIIVTTARSEREGDYSNQVIIEENNKESDYVDNNRLGTIRGATPIRSRTLTPERSDYMNQELLDEDIIPLSVAGVPSSSATAPVLMAESILAAGGNWEKKTADYVNMKKETGEEGRRDKMEISLDLNLDSREPSPGSTLQTPQLSLQQSPGTGRRSMSPQNNRESALDFRTGSPHSTPGSELVPLRSAPGSGYSSGATTPDALSLDSLDYDFDEKPLEVAPPPSLVVEDNDGPQPRGFTRAAATVRGSGGRHQHVSMLSV